MPLRNRNSRLGYKCFFVTTSCFHHLSLLPHGNGFKLLSNMINRYAYVYNCDIISYVLMPNHFHLIIYFNEDTRLSEFMREVKKQSALEIRIDIGITNPSLLHAIEYPAKGQLYKLWADGFHDFPLYSKKMVKQKLKYIHNNPLQEHWQLVPTAEQYQYSSAAFYANTTEGLIRTTLYSKYFH